MSQTNDVVESQLDALAEVCCSVMGGDEEAWGDRIDPILESLVMSGYLRTSDQPLSTAVAKRAKAKCGELARPRGVQLRGLTSELDSRIEKMSRWDTTLVDSEQEANSPPQPANISSATDA